jgi:ATP-dependent DNA helicase RecG
MSDEYISRPRNPQIAELFKDAGMFDEYGSGIRQIRAFFIDNGLRPPEFIKLPGRLIVRMFGDTTAGGEKKRMAGITDTEPEQQSDAVDIFSDRERQIIAFILEDNRIPLNDIAQKLAVSKRTIIRDIKKMKKENIIERIGNEKNGYWKINSIKSTNL